LAPLVVSIVFVKFCYSKYQVDTLVFNQIKKNKARDKTILTANPDGFVSKDSENDFYCKNVKNIDSILAVYKIKDKKIVL